MSIIYDKEERKAVDTETGRQITVKQRNQYQKYTDYWLQDGVQKYELGTDVHYEPSGRNTYDLPLKKTTKDVLWFVRVNDEGEWEDNPLPQQQSDYQKYKPIIEEMLLAYSTMGRELDEIEYTIIINFSVIEEKLGLKEKARGFRFLRNLFS